MRDPRRTATRLLVLLVLLLPLGCGRPERPPVRPLWPELYVIAPDDVPAPGEFLRYQPAGPTGGGLDIAVTEYVSDKPGQPRVQLVGVVHIADALYYEHVQAVLDRADLVLFEAIMPEGVSMEAWRAEMNAEVDGEDMDFQQELAGWFGFEHQLRAIDYQGSRFVHADMTVETFRDEGGGDLLDSSPFEVGSGSSDDLSSNTQGVVERVRTLGRLIGSEPNPLRSLFRRLMAEALGSIDEVDALAMFPGLDDLIVTRRNAHVIDVLKENLEQTEGVIAVFYGAAHNVDLEQRLVEMGYRRDSAFFLRAWALRPPLK